MTIATLSPSIDCSLASLVTRWSPVMWSPNLLDSTVNDSPLLRLVGLYIFAHLHVSQKEFFGACVIMCLRVLASSRSAASPRSIALGSGNWSRPSTGSSGASASSSEPSTTSGTRKEFLETIVTTSKNFILICDGSLIRFFDLFDFILGFSADSWHARPSNRWDDRLAVPGSGVPWKRNPYCSGYLAISGW